MWSIDNESRDYELQGKDFVKKIVFGSFFIVLFSFAFHQLTTKQSMLFSSAQVWTSSQYSVLWCISVLISEYSSLDGARLCTCGGDGIIRLLDLHTRCELVLRKTPENFR